MRAVCVCLACLCVQWLVSDEEEMLRLRERARSLEEQLAHVLDVRVFSVSPVVLLCVMCFSLTILLCCGSWCVACLLRCNGQAVRSVLRSNVTVHYNEPAVGAVTGTGRSPKSSPTLPRKSSSMLSVSAKTGPPLSLQQQADMKLLARLLENSLKQQYS